MTPIISNRQIPAANDKYAAAVDAPIDADPRSILSALDLTAPRDVVLVIGGAARVDKLPSAQRLRLQRLFDNGVVPAALELKAVLVDGGTQAGVMAMTGRAVAEQPVETRPALLGVAPAGKVAYPGGPDVSGVKDAAPLDANHSHFVLVGANDWGDETAMLFAVIEALSRGRQIVTVLVNGGAVARQEVLQSVVRGWPLVVISGSGELADEIAGYVERLRKIDVRRANRRNGLRGRLSWWFGEHRVQIAGNDMATIVKDGRITLFALADDPDRLRPLLARHLRPVPVTPLLNSAWQRFADYDQNAVQQQSTFERLQRYILGLGVVTTFLAVLYTALELAISRQEAIHSYVIGILQGAEATGAFVGLPASYLRSVTLLAGVPPAAMSLLRFAVVAVPIVVAMLVAYYNRFDAGSKWILLRATAESIKREIYRYRTRADIYRTPKLDDQDATADALLARRVGDLCRRTMRTEVNFSALKPYKGVLPPGMYGAQSVDDGFSPLTPAQYAAIRIGDQITYFRSRCVRLERRLKRLQAITYLFVGLSALLAAVSLEIWVPVAAAVATALTAYVQAQQYESTLTKYNQTMTDLLNLQDWWQALTKTERETPENIDLLVRLGEEILETENLGWVRRMQNALLELRKKQEPKAGGNGDGAPRETADASGQAPAQAATEADNGANGDESAT
jgi:hypothetical protein